MGKPRLIVRGNSVGIDCGGYDPDLVASIKDGLRIDRGGIWARYDGSEKIWWVKPHSVEEWGEVQMWTVSEGFELPEDFLALREELKRKEEKEKKAQAKAVAASQATDAKIKIEGLGGELRPFQKAGVVYLKDHNGGLLGDEMGLGKTVQALAWLQAEGHFPALVVCPAVLKLNWEREAAKWLPGRKIQVVNGGKFTVDNEADIVVINYDVLRKHKDSLLSRDWAAVILDESHYIKNHKAQRTKLAQQIGKRAKNRLLITGTPIMNRPKELISQLDFLGLLDKFGGFWPFVKRYCNAYKDRYGWNLNGASNLEELQEKLRVHCMVRREKSEVLKELPAKQRSVIPVKLSNQRVYDKAEREFLAWVAKEFGDEAAARAAKAKILARTSALRKLSAEGKIAAAGDWIENFVESGEKLVVFAHHREVISSLLSILEEKGIGAAHIVGDDDAAARQAAVDGFQSGDCRVIVCSIAAAGVGLTLTAASNVLFIELDWTPANIEQAEDRCHRIGQRNAVTAWYMIGSSIDEYMLDLLETKGKIVSESLGDNKLGAVFSQLLTETEQPKPEQPKPLWNGHYRRANIMKFAWQLAREAAEKHDGKASEFFAECLREAWAQAKEEKGKAA